ncbi:Stf0 family sulfotransferase [Afifella sp. IM 167]|uniref:Stf0 family sulfotransferase n=1 Tax=Afifella sp. IM 167 TaxID=2033586 RepID=UPI001CCF6A93
MTEAPTADALFRAVKKLGLLEHLAGREDARLLADPAAAAFLKTSWQGEFAHLLVSTDAPAAERARIGHLWALSLQDEPRLKRYAATHFPKAAVKGFVGDAAVMASARADPFGEEAEVMASPPPEVTWAILCAPRTGSTWLSNLVRETGLLGRPTEHLRPLIRFMVENRRVFGFDFARWLALLARSDQKDGIFGTKIIHDFALELSPLLTLEERRSVDRLAARSHFVHFRRRDRAAQAVSEYLAEATRTWHVRSPDGLARYEAEKAAVPYDGEKIGAAFARHGAAEERVASWLKRSGRPVLTLWYEDVLAAPRAAIEELHLFLTGRPAPAFRIPETRYQRLGNGLNEEMAGRFRREAGRQADL